MIFYYKKNTFRIRCLFIYISCGLIEKSFLGRLKLCVHVWNLFKTFHVSLRFLSLRWFAGNRVACNTTDHKLVNNHDNGCLLRKVIAAVVCYSRQILDKEDRVEGKRNVWKKKKDESLPFTWTQKRQIREKARKRVPRKLFLSENRTDFFFVLCFVLQLDYATAAATSSGVACFT